MTQKFRITEREIDNTWKDVETFLEIAAESAGKKPYTIRLVFEALAMPRQTLEKKMATPLFSGKSGEALAAVVIDENADTLKTVSRWMETERTRPADTGRPHPAAAYKFGHAFEKEELPGNATRNILITDIDGQPGGMAFYNGRLKSVFHYSEGRLKAVEDAVAPLPPVSEIRNSKPAA